MRKLKGYQKFNEELNPETYLSAARRMAKSGKPNAEERSAALIEWGEEKKARIEEQLKEMDEFVKVQMMDVDPDGYRLKHETYCAIPGRRTLAGHMSGWNITIIQDDTDEYDGLDMKEVWPILEGLKEYLTYHCENLEFDSLVGSERGSTKIRELTDDDRENDNWSWAGAKFRLK